METAELENVVMDIAGVLEAAEPPKNLLITIYLFNQSSILISGINNNGLSIALMILNISLLILVIHFKEIQ